MTTLSENNKIEFYKFLNGDITVEDLETFIFSHPYLEQQLKPETYFNLIELNFKAKYDIIKLKDIIKTRIIEEGQFEMWKLRKVLNDFITQPQKIDLNLDKIYDLYCGIYLEDGKRKYEYKFLSNLGLNYLFWANEGYLRTHYGDNWKVEYEKISADFQFYHEQLKTFATEILSAFDNKEIQIMNDGTYRISNYLKGKIETDKIYQLKHSNKKYSM